MPEPDLPETVTTRPLQAVLVEHAVSMLRPLTDAAVDASARQRLLTGLGWNLTALLGVDPDAQLADALRTCRATVVGLTARIEGGLDDLADAVYCLTKVREAVTAVIALVESWRGPQPPPSGDAPQPPAVDADPYLLFLSDLVCYLLDAHLGLRAPTVRTVLDLIGVRRIITPTAPVLIGGDVARDQRPRPFYDIGPLSELLRDPVATLRTRLFSDDTPPGVPEDLADLVGNQVAEWLNDIGLLASYGTPGASSPESGLSPAEQEAAAHLLHVIWQAAGTIDGGGGGSGGGQAAAAARLRLVVGLTRDIPQGQTSGPLAAVLASDGAFEAHLDNGAWHVDTALTGNISPVVVSRHGARFVPASSAGQLRGTLELRYGQEDPAYPVLRFGSPNGARLEIGAVRLTGSATIDAAGLTGELGLELVGARLMIEPGDDGFLAAVLPKQPIVIDLDLGLSWSPATGLTLRGAARLDQTFPVGRTLGPLTVQQIRVALAPTDDGAVELRLSTDLTVVLGPITASVAGLGLRAALSRADGPGTLGPLDLAVAFLPPAGVGIAVNAAVVTGGGYLYADHATGEYAGAIQLKFAALQLSAVGLLSTRMPDGRKGFSLLVLISVRFPPVQLGFGFALTGVGGLVGVHRSVDLEALRSGLADGALDRVLFPADVVANAQRIVRDIGSYFPATTGQYVVGPTVELSWGAQGILTARLGLFIEFPTPTRVVLAGQLRLALPPGTNPPIILVQVDLLGALDFDKKTLAIDGVLRDSRIASLTLSGSLAVRANWGDQPSFIISVGGLNPRFPKPAKFPVLRRVTLSIAERENLRLRLAGYVALTSNTVQFGARVDLYASVSVPLLGTFAISALVSFDALITISPFSFVVDFSVAVALTWDGDPVLAVHLEATLTGPRPWHAVGSATFQLFGKHTIHFDITVGRRAVSPPPTLVDLGGRVRSALEDRESWTAELPTEGEPMVTLAEVAQTQQAILVHPLGTLTAAQKVAPLNRVIEHYGAARLSGALTPPFVINQITLDGQSVATRDVNDRFAPAEFLDLTDAEKLSRPSFELWTAGVRVDDSNLTMPPSAACTVSASYDQRRVNTDGSVATLAPMALPDERMRLQAASGAAAVNGVQAQGERAYAGDELGVSVVETRFAVVRVIAPTSGVIAALQPELMMLDSFADAREALRQAASEQPELAASLRLVDHDDVPRGVS